MACLTLRMFIPLYIPQEALGGLPAMMMLIDQVNYVNRVSFKDWNLSFDDVSKNKIQFHHSASIIKNIHL